MLIITLWNILLGVSVILGVPEVLLLHWFKTSLVSLSHILIKQTIFLFYCLNENSIKGSLIARNGYVSLVSNYSRACCCTQLAVRQKQYLIIYMLQCCEVLLVLSYVVFSCSVALEMNSFKCLNNLNMQLYLWWLYNYP